MKNVPDYRSTPDFALDAERYSSTIAAMSVGQEWEFLYLDFQYL